METRKESLSALKLCRFCLCQDDCLTSLYERSRAPKNSVPLALKILSCVSIEVFPSDKMPSYICNRCKFFMELSYDYKQLCRQADENILQFVQNGTTLKSINWPASLNKVFRLSNKGEMSVMKTVVEGGATVQVTVQESDSEDDDDENMYIKMDDASDGTKGARVKVITSDKSDKGKAKGNKDRSPFKQDVGRFMDERWPCDECDCTYPLQQLLELHKATKHRERKVNCNKCDAKFFTTYELATHQITHSDETQFQCLVCDKRFKRYVLLKRHEKLIHADLLQRPCPRCPATFLTIEELEAHKVKHIHDADKPFQCGECDKKFYDKSTLHRHKENVHKAPLLCCEYCPSRFSSVSKLQRHVRAHAGERPYPCKYCNKSFIKSHHYTRHLRLKHRETIRTCRGPFGESDQFRCEECEDVFATQDELIYHSAIHATQNLICPLCQEKFDDVDAVTTHIKSHVTGTEFMCDYCELIFTTKDKLTNHMAAMHEDEMLNDQDIPHDESSMDVDPDDEEDDSGFKVKEEGDHMVVEIKKPDEFLLSNRQTDSEEKVDNTTNSEESEPEATYTELSTVDTLSIARKDTKPDKPVTASFVGAIITKNAAPPVKAADKKDTLAATLLQKAEETKRKNLSTPEPDKKDKPSNKAETTNSSTGVNDKTLRLLEKELQELKRTNTNRSEVLKTSAKSVETPRSRRAPVHIATPKPRTPVPEEKKTSAPVKTPQIEKRAQERRTVTKENKEPKESKDTKGNNNGNAKEESKEKEVKEKETPKTIVKNGTSEKTPEEGIRRSTRPSKIKDYAKMIRDKSQESDENDDSDYDDEEYKETEKPTEVKPKPRRSSLKTTPKPAATASPATTPATPATTPARKRGRPRKEPAPVPMKVKKDDDEEVTTTKAEPETTAKEEDKQPEEIVPEAKEPEKEVEKISAPEPATTPVKPAVATEQKPSVLMSPTGQPLKKIPIKALPPGVRPLPLPRQVGSGEVCEMQIGKKVVKVQKIVMTKAEVEAMAKKGLVEMKDGTMVLKQGIKIPTSDPAAIKSLVADSDVSKESQSAKKKEKATPTRCTLGDEA